jgi:hypothetical protein
VHVVTSGKKGKRVIPTVDVTLPDGGCNQGETGNHKCTLVSRSTTAIYVKVEGVSQQPHLIEYTGLDGTSSKTWNDEVLVTRPTRRPLRKAGSAQAPACDSGFHCVSSASDQAQLLTVISYRDPDAGFHVPVDQLATEVPLKNPGN